MTFVDLVAIYVLGILIHRPIFVIEQHDLMLLKLMNLTVNVIAILISIVIVIVILNQVQDDFDYVLGSSFSCLKMRLLYFSFSNL